MSDLEELEKQIHKTKKLINRIQDRINKIELHKCGIQLIEIGTIHRTDSPR